jgi:ATP-dependent helicase/nuclease subunit B
MKNIFSIAFGNSPIDILSKKLLEDTITCKESLADYLILVPNTRIIKKFQDSFLKNSSGNATLLPKIVSVEDMEHILSSASLINSNILEKKEYKGIFKKALSPQGRSFLLSKLIKQKEKNISLAQSIYMAKQLGALMDESYRQEINLDNIENIVDSTLAHHFQESLKFINIAKNVYPEILEQLQLIDQAQKQTLIYKIHAEIWQIKKPTHPVILFNITSYYPCVLNMLKCLKNNNNTSLYFYGLDLENFGVEKSFNHPQKILEHTLKYLKIEKQDVIHIADNPKHSIINSIFHTQINKNIIKKDVKNFSENISIINTKNEEEEARSIALILREILETQNKTAGVVTNNTQLVKRIKNELTLWNIDLNDFLGEPLNETLNAKLFLLIAKIINVGFEPNLLLALLKHPMATFGKARREIFEIASYLDLHILRQPINKNLNNFYDINTIINLCENHKNTNQKVISFLKTLATIFLGIHKENTFQNILISHIKICESITKTEDENIEIWATQAGKELSLLLGTTMENSGILSNVSFKEYLEVIEDIIQDIKIRSIYNKHSRLYIYGNMQSTLLHHDVIILAGMNELCMPKPIVKNPWLNSYMRLSLGLLPEEHVLGLESLSFCQNLSCNEIILTRSEKESGTITTASPWLLRIQTFLAYYGITSFTKKNYIYEIAKTLYLDQEPKKAPSEIASFNPSKEFRPLEIATTKLELLIQNPYVFFIDKILKLKPLEPINVDLTYKNYGVKIHKILEDFFKDYKINQQLSLEEQKSILHKLFNKNFEDVSNTIKFQVFTRPIALKDLYDFATFNFDYFKQIKAVFIETKGEMTLNINHNTNIKITGIADRIDILENKIVINDYKTSKARVQKYQQQLYVLPLILTNNGFNSVIYKNGVDISAQYIYLQKHIKERVKSITLEDISKNNNNIETLSSYNEKLIELLNSYYCENHIPYTFSTDKNITKEHLHFARYNKWNILEDTEEEEKEEEDE